MFKQFILLIYSGIILLAMTRCTTVAIVGGGAVVSTSVLREKSTIESVSDTVISAKISKAIYKINPDIHATIGINVQEGEVLLTGTVPSNNLKIAVEKAVWPIKGVKQMYNYIDISDKAPISNYHKDAWITSQIKTKLIACSRIRSINYSVKTVNNVVYIFGIAKSNEELEEVCDIASHVRGVLRVMSYIRLK
ncbi:MAG: BON domain-containing protein [Holosporales bacterium]|jgi:osmotically-inducible protein OsmY|nr:BON domain-containing protein [Holosporales bacterium]